MSNEENMTFAERWSKLLEECNSKLKDQAFVGDRDMQVRQLWTDINRFVSIMAVPEEVRSSMRKTLWLMSRNSSWKQSCLISLYLLFTFLPRYMYRNVNVRQWFKERLGSR